MAEDVVVKLGQCERGQTAGDAAEAGADGFDRKMQQCDGGGRAESDDNGAGDTLGIFQAENHDGQGSERHGGSLPGNGVRGLGERLHAVEEIARDVVHAQAEQVPDLSAGDQDGNAVGEADDHRAWKILHRGAHAGDAEKDEQNAGHHGAHEEAVDAVFGDNAGNDYDECAGRPADLRFGAAESGHDESSDDGAIDSGLWGHAGGDGKGHGQRQRDQADGYSRNEVGQKFVAIVIAQQDYGFGQPGV